MKLNKTSKFLILLSVLALTLLMACSMMTGYSAKADFIKTFTFDKGLSDYAIIQVDEIYVVKDYKLSKSLFSGEFNGGDKIDFSKEEDKAYFAFKDNFTEEGDKISFSGNTRLVISQTVNGEEKEMRYDIFVKDQLCILKSNVFNVSNNNNGNGGSIALVASTQYSYSNTTGLYGKYLFTKDGVSNSEVIAFGKSSFEMDSTAMDGKLRFDKNDSYFGFEIINGNDNVVLTDAITVKNSKEEEIAKFKLEVLKDEEAPEYFHLNNTLKNAYQTKLEKALKTDDGTYVQLGSGKTITLPSMEDFVIDNVTPYSKLTYQIYYKNKNYAEFTKYPSSFSGTSSMKLEVATPGYYEFFVVFKDAVGNEMKVDLDEGKIIINGSEEDISDYIISFEIYEDYNVKVEASSATISDGYVNSKYTLGTSYFTTDGCKVTYKLSYSAEANGTFEDVTDNKDISFSSSDLSFTPDKEGYYKIECSGKTTSTGIDAGSASVTVKVGEAVSEVKAPSEFSLWIKNNVLSVVFLGIGVLCLIAIIVLLCIKPKDDSENTSSKE